MSFLANPEHHKSGALLPRHQPTTQPMKPTTIPILALVLAGLPAGAQTILSTEHVDVGVNYADGEWDLHVHDETNDAEYEPGDVILRVNAAAQTTVPDNPLFNFLGAPGGPVWILPNTQNPDLLFLGIGAEELESGLFVGDSVTLRLHGLSGPGHFALFDFNSLGEPLALMNSRDGFSAADAFTVIPGGHSDLNWAFSAPGLYTLSFEASGTLADGNRFTSSGPVDYTFEVVPEPGTWTLLALCLGGAWLMARRRRARA
jgi:surface-anchored protein